MGEAAHNPHAAIEARAYERGHKFAEVELTNLRQQRDEWEERAETAEADVKRLTVEAQASQRNSDRADAREDEANAEVEHLKKIIHDDNAVCLCGCPPEDHEEYPEGEACKDETHECLRVSLGVKKIVDKLRLDAEVAEAAARPGQPLPCGHPQHLAFSYDHHGEKIDCLMCLIVRLTDAVKPLAAFSTADMVQVSAGRNIITGADAQIAARTVKDSKAAQAFYAKRVVDGPTPECGTSPPCTGCEKLEDRLVKMRIEWGEEQRELEEKSQIIDIVLNGLGVDAGDWDQSPKAAEDLVKAVLRYIAGEEDVWNGQEPGGSVVLAVHDRFKELKARIADLELALKDDANLRAFCDKEVIRENGELKRRVVALETTEHGLQDRLASADDALADLKTRLAEVEGNTNGYKSAARFRDKLAEIEPQFDAAKKQIVALEADVDRRARTLGLRNDQLRRRDARVRILSRIAATSPAWQDIQAELSVMNQEEEAMLGHPDNPVVLHERIQRLEAKVRGHLAMDTINAKITCAKGDFHYSTADLVHDMREALDFFKRGHGAQVEDQD